MSIQSEISRISGAVSTQESLISQIATVLTGKSGGSGENIPASASGYTEFDVFVSKHTGLTVQCLMAGEKDWGDGTINSLTEHAYADYGDYTIVCRGNTIPNGSSSSGGVFGSGASNAARYLCKAARIGTNVTSIANYAFFSCQALTYVHIPDSVVSLGTTAFRNCFALERVRLSAKVTAIPGNCFYNDYALRVIDLSNINSIASGALQNCYSVRSVRLGLVTDIAATAFSNAYSVMAYDLSAAESVPTLGNTTAFTGINGTCKIIVPDALYADWIAATNWASYADYIYKASEVA